VKRITTQIPPTVSAISKAWNVPSEKTRTTMRAKVVSKSPSAEAFDMARDIDRKTVKIKIRQIRRCTTCLCSVEYFLNVMTYAICKLLDKQLKHTNKSENGLLKYLQTASICEDSTVKSCGPASERMSQSSTWRRSSTLHRLQLSFVRPREKD